MTERNINIALMTSSEVNQILNSPCTHRLVFKVLDLACQCDIVDAIGDLEIVTEILKTKLRGDR